MTKHGQSRNKRSIKIVAVTFTILALLAIAAVALGLKVVFDDNDDAKPGAVMLWEKDIPYYQDNHVKIGYDRINSEVPYIPAFVVNMFLDSNFNMKPKLQLFALRNGAINPAMIIFPGGAYMGRAESHEGVEIAGWLNSIGISAFVVDYRVVPYHQPAQLVDATRAIRYLRFHAREYNIDPHRIGVIGFSAGGHLASTLGTHFDAGSPTSEDPVERMSSRPDLMILGYPVITMGKYTHQISKWILLGPNPSSGLEDRFSSEKQVSAQTPPTFIWQTENDSVVGVENTYLFAEALKRNHVVHELHIFPDGRHGLGLAEGKEVVKEWPKMAEKWLKGNGF